MARFVAISLFAFLCAPSVSFAESLGDRIATCAETQDSLARLSCYDTLAKEVRSAEAVTSVETAFEEFRNLARSDFRPEVGAREFFISECTFFDTGFYGERKDEERVGTSVRDAKFEVLPSEVNYIPTFDIWNLIVDLREVDPIELSLDGKGYTNIVMRRGAELRWANLKAQLSNYNFFTVEQARSVGQRTVSIAQNIFNFSDPKSWLQYASDEAAIRNILFASGDPNGYFAPWVLESSFKLENTRSTRWSFFDMWPEDAKKIHEAFERLVQSCQK